MLAMSVTVTTYCLWAFERAGRLGPAERAEDIVWFELSIIPFVLAVLVVELAIEQGRGGEPEELAAQRSWPAGARPRVARLVDLRDLRMNVASRRELLAGWGRSAPSRATLVRPESVSELEDLVRPRTWHASHGRPRSRSLLR